jgi:opacity protein-like surface antigen
MKRPRCFLGRGLWLGLLICLTVSGSWAASQPANPRSDFNRRHQLGARLGVWGNLGGTALKADTSGSSFYETDIKSASFYFEGYFGYRLSPALMLELAGGIVNRGDVTITDNGESFIGNLVVYPIQLRLKLYPLAFASTRLQPYVMGGGGIYHGRNNIQFTNSANPFVTYVGESQTDLNFVLGGGVDLPIASSIALDGSVAYMPIHFSKDLIFIRNYEAVTVTVGAKYVLPITKKK